MGIYGALATAVSGLRAQSFALENISGNIANSQTTGYKRIETSFLDLIPDAPVKSQVPGAVLAQSRATNTDRGDVVSSAIDTHMALNGSGFFVVEERIGQNDGNSIFGGASYYTRRGDFDVDKEGYLVNGAGYFLKGLPIDQSSGNISGSVPEVIKLSNSFLPAQTTSRIDYQLNLPQLPKNAGYDASTPNSELLDPANYMTIPVADITATVTGTVATLTGAAVTPGVFADGETLSFSADGTTHVFGFNDGGGAVTGADTVINTNANTIAGVLASIQSTLQGLGGAFNDATVALNGAPGAVEVTLGTNLTASVTLTPSASLGTALGLTGGTTLPTDQSLNYQVATIRASDGDAFLTNSIAGGAITTYSSNGAPVNVQMRWAKVASPAIGGVDRWNLFYLQDSTATGSAPMWQNTGVNYDFDASGAMNPPVTSTTLNGLTVNGVTVGDVTLQHNTGGVTQFSDANGTGKVTALQQNGYPAGEFISVTVNESGRVVASYTNGQQVELAQVIIAEFNAPNSLKRLDGGLFAATSESGEAILDSSGGILGGTLESSNTDISEEFTKLITTQQAYAAGTRIVSTADEMLQEALNMVR